MDVDVVLNACLETYQKDELQKVREAARIKRQQQEALTSSMSSKLFNNGIVIANLTELTISQSRDMQPVFEMGTARTFTVPGRELVTGTFHVDYNEELYRRMNQHVFEYAVRTTYHIDSEQLFSNGSSHRIAIHNVEIAEEPTTKPGKVAYRYTASHVVNTSHEMR